MLRATSSRRAAALLAAALMIPWASTASSRKSGRPALENLAPIKLLARLWLVVNPWAKEGMHIDPSGQSAEPPEDSGPASETGMHIDPSGQPDS